MMRLTMAFARGILRRRARRRRSRPSSALQGRILRQVGYDNLTLVGDWTDTGQNVGCVEAAVISGIAAASAAPLSIARMAP